MPSLDERARELAGFEDWSARVAQLELSEADERALRVRVLQVRVFGVVQRAASNTRPRPRRRTA